MVLFLRFVKRSGVFMALVLMAFACRAEMTIHNVLVLHSYEPSYQWTRDLQLGIDNALADAQVQTKLSIEYLDSKRRSEAEYFRQFENYFAEKYRDYAFDAVIVTDDNALIMLKRLAYLLDSEIPVVAVGINSSRLTLNEEFTHNRIYYSEDKTLENLNLIGQVRPKLNKLYFLTDKSHTAHFVALQVRKILKRSDISHVELVIIDDLSLAQAAEFVSGISPGDAVLLSHFNTEVPKGVYHPYREVSYEIGRASAAPVFVMWQFYIRYGVLGGVVNHSEQLGRTAVYALDELVTLNMVQEPEYAGSYRPVFSWPAMQRHGISRTLLPEDALIVDRPMSIWEKHWRIIVISAVIIAFLLVVILAQWALLRHKRTIARNNRRIYLLQRRTLSVQKEMILLLGEAIESRSGETGNHVKRVARISAHLAQLHGLSHREVEMLEIVSPMHDVGKISISESILDKPGKLTEKEWAVMKQHTTAGYNLLSTSKGELFRLAAIVAHQHHERWDGTGYPMGLGATDIHVFARITAIADVFDALLSERCYKAAWSVRAVTEYFFKGAGSQFDPALTELLLDNIDDFLAIRHQYPDR